MKTKTQFRNLQEVIRTFSDENYCREFLEKQRWNGTPVCPKCNSTHKIYHIENNKRLKCGVCLHKFSVTVGTIFENTKINLGTWFIAIYICTAHKKGISSLQLSRDLGVSQKTAWFILHRVREMLREKNPQLLGNTVEVDETYYGGLEKNKHKNKRTPNTQGRNIETKKPILGLIERKGKIVVTPVKDVTGETLKGIIYERIIPKSIVITDEWRSYNGLSVNFNHLRVEHGKGNYVNGIAHTNSLEGFWSLLKRGVHGIYHSVSSKHLQRYCDEFSYRYNTREITDTERFVNSFTHTEGRLLYKNLIGKFNEKETQEKEKTVKTL